MAHASVKKIPAAGVLGTQRVRIRRDPGDMGFLYLSLGAVCVVLVVLFLYLGCRVSVTKYGYEISRALTERADLMEDNDRLKLEITRLKSPERIESVAMSELGLVYPGGDRIIRVR